MTILMPLFLLPAAASMNELDVSASSCGATAQTEPRRCLIQQNPSRTAAMYVDETAGASKGGAFVDALVAGEENLSREDIAHMLEIIMEEQPATAEQTSATALGGEKGAWTGKAVNVEFGATSIDMQHVQALTVNDYVASEETAVALASNTTKTYFEMSFPQEDGAQIVSNSTADKIYMYGFRLGTGGLENMRDQRIWFQKPGSKGAKLLYGFKMSQVPGKSAWKYNVEFTHPQPDTLKLYPPNGKVAQKGNHLFVVMECPEDDLCADRKIVISAITFSPEAKPDKEEMEVAEAEEVTGTGDKGEHTTPKP